MIWKELNLVWANKCSVGTHFTLILNGWLHYIYVPCDKGKLLILLVGRFPSINVLYDWDNSMYDFQIKQQVMQHFKKGNQKKKKNLIVHINPLKKIMTKAFDGLKNFYEENRMISKLVWRSILNIVTYWGFGGRLLAAETLDPHLSSSLPVSSLWTIASIKHKQSFFSTAAVSIASTSSCSQPTRDRRMTKRFPRDTWISMLSIGLH